MKLGCVITLIVEYNTISPPSLPALPFRQAGKSPILYQLHPPPNLPPKRGRLEGILVPLPSSGEGDRGWGEVWNNMLHDS
ncbi:MAG: hypothetical protein AMS27_12310 [Bacteroides sp. SM23_62_1]|nr:MAG: hypothetical protein AMS27_12310 [Bacteroides sp. SM23_62_1]